MTYKVLSAGHAIENSKNADFRTKILRGMYEEIINQSKLGNWEASRSFNHEVITEEELKSAIEDLENNEFIASYDKVDDVFIITAKWIEY